MHFFCAVQTTLQVGFGAATSMEREAVGGDFPPGWRVSYAVVSERRTWEVLA